MNINECGCRPYGWLGLDGNRCIRVIPRQNKTSKLWISDNPYECNCDMLWMKDWLMDNENVMDKKNVTCSGSKVKGKAHIHRSKSSLTSTKTK